MIGDFLWARNYLFYLGLVPLFAISDSLYQGISRYNYLQNFLEINSLYVEEKIPLLVCVIYCFFTMIGIVYHYDVLMGLVLMFVYFYSSRINKYELILSSNRSVFSQSLAEISLCAIFVLLEFSFAKPAILFFVFGAFPVSKIFALYINRMYVNYNAPTISSGLTKFAFVSKSLFSQLASSLAASAPSIVLFADAGSSKNIAEVLMYFKILFSGSAIFSTVINLIGSRLFYGVIELKVMSADARLEKIQATYIVALLVINIFSFIYLLSHDGNPISMLLPLLLSFSYLNLISSLTLSKGDPNTSFISQSILLLGAYAFAIFLFFNDYIALLLFGIYSIASIAFICRTKVHKYIWSKPL